MMFEPGRQIGAVEVRQSRLDDFGAIGVKLGSAFPGGTDNCNVPRLFGIRIGQGSNHQLPLVGDLLRLAITAQVPPALLRTLALQPVELSICQ